MSEGSAANKPVARMGRPPASSADDTRRRIIGVAAELFAANGYGVTTNRDVAVRSGITTGALYYYFESKLAMYLAVFWELQERVDDRLNRVMAEEETFEARVRAILEAVYQMNREDPSISRFQGTARVDRMRHPELREAIPHAPGEGAHLMRTLIDGGVATGEIDPKRKKVVEAVMRAIIVGLVDSSSQPTGPAEHRRAIDGIEALFDGTLVTRRPRRPRRRST